ncbi:hypothetical protein [Kluyvera sichuanensis]|uniref:hypothetical protein n=1 Tax=Kluyvera sichuanensis TaxID=2725494 RepID=UPI0034A2DAAE
MEKFKLFIPMDDYIRRGIITCFLSSTLLFSGASVAVSKYPIISGDISSPECLDAFALSKAMFDARSSRLYAPLTIPKSVNSKFVLGATKVDISGGRELSADNSVFETVDVSGGGRRRDFFIAKTPKYGIRLFLRESFSGWRGDTYSLYFLDAAKEQSKALADISAGRESDSKKEVHSEILRSTWRPPIIFEGLSKALWFIVVGEWYQIMPDWTVYREEPDGFKQACVISFRPKGNTGTELLPKEVRKFARLVDGTIGNGPLEGTLQSTLYIRIGVQQGWANAILRPWALSDDDAYNSTEQVNAALLEWSKKAPSFRRLYKEIIHTYPVAENALTHYYIRHFGLKKKEAKELAAWVMNVMFRVNFVFHRETEDQNKQGGDVNPNPLWKEGITP